MDIEQHLGALPGKGNQPKCASDAQIHMRDLDAWEQAADQWTFYTPIAMQPHRVQGCQYKGLYRLILLPAPRALRPYGSSAVSYFLRVDLFDARLRSPAPGPAVASASC